MRREHIQYSSFILLYSIVILCSYILSYLFSSKNPVISCSILFIIGVVGYFVLAIRLKNYLSSLAIFTGVWLITIGLSQLRLNTYQTTWGIKTWVLLCSGHFSFILGSHFVYFIKKVNMPHVKKINLEITSYFDRKIFKKNFLIVTLAFSYLGILAFIANVLVRGYIPAFITQNNQNAYFEFYTRYHIFYVASLVTCGLSYFMIVKWEVARIFKFLLAINIFILLIIIPLLQVQRGTFLTGALIYISVVYYIGDRSFVSLVKNVVIIIIVFAFGTFLRGYSNEQLSSFFPQTKSYESSESYESYEPRNAPEGLERESDSGSALPPKVLFLYAYLTVSHENFNSVVVNSTANTNGVWQLKPFNVLLRSKVLNEKIDVAKKLAEKYMVRPYLNTFNLITMAYFDFGLLGVILFMVFWSSIFGIIENFALEIRDPFSTSLYGVCLTPIGLCFMNPWLSEFTIWLLWGTILLIFSIQFFSSFFTRNNRRTI